MKESELVKNAQRVIKMLCELYELYKTGFIVMPIINFQAEADAEDAVMDCILCAWQGIKQLKKAELFRLGYLKFCALPVQNTLIIRRKAG